MMYTTGKLYEVSKSGRPVIGNDVPIRIISALAPSIAIYGSEQVPDAVSDMQNIHSESTPIIVSDYYRFASIPRYIAFIGTADDIEVSNCKLDEIKDIT